jgi:hypothetical protein
MFDARPHLRLHPLKLHGQFFAQAFRHCFKKKVTKRERFLGEMERVVRIQTARNSSVVSCKPLCQNAPSVTRLFHSRVRLNQRFPNDHILCCMAGRFFIKASSA